MANPRPTIDEREDLLAMLLACVKLAGQRAPADKPGADVFGVINVLGQVHPELLGPARERMMSELRRRDWVRLERRGNQVYWLLTSAGQARLGQAPSALEAEAEL